MATVTVGRVVGLGALRVVATAHLGLLLAQPVLAGAFLSGRFDMLAAHRTIGGIVVALGMAQIVAAVLAVWPGGRSGWAIPAAVAVFALDAVQIAVGYAHSFGLHLPLGVTLCAASIAFTGWAWLPRRVAGGAR